MDPKLKVKLIGLLMALGCAGFWIYNWYTALTDHTYMVKSSFLFPMFAFVGLALFIHPISKAESLAKYGTEQMPYQHFPAIWKILMATGIIVGVLNWAFISGRL